VDHGGYKRCRRPAGLFHCVAGAHHAPPTYDRILAERVRGEIGPGCVSGLRLVHTDDGHFGFFTAAVAAFRGVRIFCRMPATRLSWRLRALTLSVPGISTQRLGALDSNRLDSSATAQWSPERPISPSCGNLDYRVRHNVLRTRPATHGLHDKRVGIRHYGLFRAPAQSGMAYRPPPRRNDSDVPTLRTLFGNHRRRLRAPHPPVLLVLVQDEHLLGTANCFRFGRVGVEQQQRPQVDYSTRCPRPPRRLASVRVQLNVRCQRDDAPSPPYAVRSACRAGIPDSPSSGPRRSGDDSSLGRKNSNGCRPSRTSLFTKPLQSYGVLEGTSLSPATWKKSAPRTLGSERAARDTLSKKGAKDDPAGERAVGPITESWPPRFTDLVLRPECI